MNGVLAGAHNRAITGQSPQCRLEKQVGGGVLPCTHQCIWRLGVGFTWAPTVCKIMAFRAVTMGLGLLFYILLGFR